MVQGQRGQHARRALEAGQAFLVAGQVLGQDLDGDWNKSGWTP